MTQNASNQLKLAEKQAIRPNSKKKLNVCQKVVENTQNRLEMIFMTKDQKKCVFNQFVYQIRVKTRLIIQNSLTNDQNGQTAQKLKRG